MLRNVPKEAITKTYEYFDNKEPIPMGIHEKMMEINSIIKSCVVYYEIENSGKNDDSAAFHIEYSWRKVA